MSSNSVPLQESPSLRAVLEAVEDADCRTILCETTEPITATDLIEICDISRSTVYRKLRLLSQASLVKEIDTIRPGGGRLTRYKRDFDEITISVGEDGALSLTVERPSEEMDEQLKGLWSEIGGGMTSSSP